MGRKRKSEARSDGTETKVLRLSLEEEGDNEAIQEDLDGTNEQKPGTTEASLADVEPTIRSQRKRKVRSKSNDEKSILQAGYKGRFTIGEKEKLLAALKRHGPEDCEILAKSVPTRTPMEIKWFIDTKKKPTVKVPKQNKGPRAPIQQWLSEVNNLTRNAVDYSSMLAQVMAVAGHYELRKPKKHMMSPNYTDIYAYLTQLLEGTFPDVTQLKPIDAVIILDLLQGLAEDMKSFDLTDQCKLMLAKYKLLNTRIGPANTNEAYKTVARALQDDLLEGEDSESEPPGNVPKKRPVSSAAGSAQDLVASAGASLSGTVAVSSTPALSINTDTRYSTGPSNHSGNNRTTNETNNPQVNDTTEDDNVGASPTGTNMVQVKTKRRGTGQGVRFPVIEAKKSKLYTLNPFVIGVKYLKPPRKGPTAQDTAANIDAGFSSPT